MLINKQFKLTVSTHKRVKKRTAALASVDGGSSIEATPRAQVGRRQELETVTASAAPYNAAFRYRWKRNGGEK